MSSTSHIEICTLSGYNDVGKNCTAIRVNNTVIVCDMGIHIENYVKYTESEDLIDVSADDMIAVQAIPDISQLGDWAPLVKAIVLSHAHMDHIGAVPFLAHTFHAPILCTPFTSEVLSRMYRDEKIKPQNTIIALLSGHQHTINDDVTIEFVNVTHSTPQAVIVVIHTPCGAIVYTNDFKLDTMPTLGKKTDTLRLGRVGDKGVLCMIGDATYSRMEGKMPSEAVAQTLLKDALLGLSLQGRAVVVTTFSSHIARLKAIVQLGQQLGRRVLFLGRSLAKYVESAQAVGIASFSDVEIVPFRSLIRKRLHSFRDGGRDEVLLVVAGHQGEPKSTLVRMARGELDFRLKRDDVVLFSSNVIPTPTNKKNREIIESELREIGVKVLVGLHVSGHAAQEDLAEMLRLLKPMMVIPSHGHRELREGLSTLCEKSHPHPFPVTMMNDGDRLVLSNQSFK